MKEEREAIYVEVLNKPKFLDILEFHRKEGNYKSQARQIEEFINKEHKRLKL